METGAFGWKFQDQIQPILDAYDRQSEDIRRNGAEGQLARMQAVDDAMANGSARRDQTLDAPYGVTRQSDQAASRAGAPSALVMNGGGSQFGNAGFQVGAGSGGFMDRPSLGQLGPDGPGSAAMLSTQLPEWMAVNPPNAIQRPEDGSIEANGGILGALHNIYRGAADAITKPEVTDVIKRQSEYLRRAGDAVGLGGTGLAVAGTVTAQPELIAPGMAGMGLGEALSTLGSAGVALSDVLANDRKAAIRDSVGGLVGSKLPYTIDPQKSVIDRTAGYFGF
jgi:hypothetical protein